jgi:hypothetical protein
MNEQEVEENKKRLRMVRKNKMKETTDGITRKGKRERTTG